MAIIYIAKISHKAFNLNKVVQENLHMILASSMLWNKNSSNLSLKWTYSQEPTNSLCTTNSLAKANKTHPLQASLLESNKISITMGP